MELDINVKDLLALYSKNNQNITQAAKEYSQLHDIEYNDSFRRKCSRQLSLHFNDFEDPEEELGILSALRTDGKIMNIEEYCSYHNLPRAQIKNYKLITHTGIPYYNITSNTIVLEDNDKFARELIEELKNYAPKFKPIKRSKPKREDSHLLVLDPADIHIGKLADSFETGEDYNSEKAVIAAKSGVVGIIEKTQGFHIDQILFIGGNDILHIDTPRGTTTSGTYQNTSGMWYSNFLKAKQLYIDIMEMLLTVAPVHFVYNPSNHDYMSGFFLADVIKTYFQHHKDVTFDTDMKHRKYFRYGANLIGTTHGDGSKERDLPLLMADESSDWSKCKHRYIYTHHIHHKTSKDYIGVTIESLRSPSPADSWHHRQGYVGVPKAIEGFIHHKDFGQVCRLTHIL